MNRRGRPLRSISKDTCHELIVLLEGGYQLPKALTLLSEHDSPQILRVKRNCELGLSDADALADVLPHTYRKYFSVFSQFLDVHKALVLTGNIVDEKQKTMEETISKLLYPIILLVGVCAGMLVFNTAVFPSMLSMASDFGTDMSFYIALQKTVSVVDVLFMGLCALLGIAGAFLLHPRMITKTYRFLVRRFPQNLLVQKASEEFAFYFVTCFRCDDNTSLILSILKDLEDKPLVRHIAVRIEWMIEKMGENMNDALKAAEVESMLLRYFSAGSIAGQVLKMMEQYLRMTKERNDKRIRRFASCVQAFSYIAVGIVIVLVYQVLMLPMQMISQF